MKKQKNNLDEAVNALKNELIPPGPSQQTIDVTSQKLMEAEPGTIKSGIKITERIKTMKPFTKLAAAAAIIAIAALSLTFFDKSVTPAYALEQTIEANRAIRYLHFRYFYKSQKDVAKEFWLEFDENGKLKNARINFSKWVGARQVIVWGENETRVLDRKQNTLTFFSDEIYTAKVLRAARKYDTKQAVESLYERKTKDEVEIEIDMPSNEVDPIVVTGTYLPNTYLPEGSMPKMREILFVDQATKLVTAIEIYKLKDGEYEYLGVYEYQGYDQPFDTKIFSLEDEVPADAMRIYERTGGDIGLPQGDLTDKEIAIKVVREFFEALIAEDYTKAGQLFGGMPATEAQERFGNLNVLRIVSIDEPIKHDKPSSLRVPCIIEIEQDGQVIQWQPDGPCVRQVYRRAGRWRIIGGI